WRGDVATHFGRHSTLEADDDARSALPRLSRRRVRRSPGVNAARLTKLMAVKRYSRIVDHVNDDHACDATAVADARKPEQRINRPHVQRRAPRKSLSHGIVCINDREAHQAGGWPVDSKRHDNCRLVSSIQIPPAVHLDTTCSSSSIHLQKSRLAT